jgi:Uncharacterised protein family (UPF0183)
MHRHWSRSQYYACTLLLNYSTCSLPLRTQILQLHFDPASQKLRLITVTDLSLLTLSKGRTVFSGSNCQPTFQLVYRLFGPTFPGRYDAAAGTYILQVSSAAVLCMHAHTCVFL